MLYILPQTGELNNKTDLYNKLIIRALSIGKSLTAFDISEEIEKSLPLTNKLLASLVKEGILKESGLAISTGGRRPATYTISPDRIYVLSVAMDQYITRVSVIDLSSMAVLNLKKYDLPLIQNEASLNQFIEILQKYLAEGFVDPEKLLGIGIGMPGFVDVKKGINYSYFTVKGGKNLSLSEFIEKKIGLPVFLDNDSSTIALTEYKLGPGAGKNNSLVINFGWGVGLGMILDGKLFRGNNGFAGEFSHIPLFNNNKLCSCGKSGCLETGASMLTIIHDFKEALESGRVSCIKKLPDDLETASREIVEAAISGDQLAVELFTQAAYDIGRGIAILIHILNPEQIIISGRGAQVGSLLLAPIHQAISKFCIPRLASYTDIVVSDLTENSEIFGAATLITENMIKKKINLNINSSEIEKNLKT